jgi:hypothetical protein
MMQFRKDSTKTHRFFNSIKRGDHLVITPNGKKYNSNTGMVDGCQQNEAEHFLVFSMDQLAMWTDNESSYVYDDNGGVIGENDYVHEEPDMYTVYGTLITHTGTWTTDTGMLNFTHELSAHYYEDTDRWVINFVEKDSISFVKIHFYCSEIHDIINFSGEKSIPTLCAEECAKRTYQRDKFNFFSVLKDRFGDILAIDLARKTFPKVDTFIAGHSQLNWP